MKARKRIAIVLAAMLAITSAFSATVYAEGGGITRGEAVEMLLTAADDYNPGVQKTDIIKGDKNGDLREEDAVTRAEALIMLERAFGGFPELKGDGLRTALPAEEFTDIPQWAEEALEPVFAAGIAEGTAPGVFSPNEPVTQEEMELFISRAYRVYGSNLKDSYYATLHKEYLDASVIPDGSEETGAFAEIEERTRNQITEIIMEAVESEPEKGSAQERIKILYENIMDMEARNAAGYDPIKEDLEAIAGIESVADLTETEISGDPALAYFVDFWLTVDAMDSNSYITYFMVADPTESRQVYTGEDENTKQAYLKCLTTLLTLCGEEEAQAKADVQAYFDLEAEISDAMLPLVEQYDVEKTYNIYTLEELKEIFATVDLEAVFAARGLSGREKIMVTDVGKMEKVASLLKDENIDALKNYLKCNLIDNSAQFFGEEFLGANQTYNQEALGIVGERPLEERAVSKVSDVLAEDIGKLYAEAYCSEEIVADVTDMIHQIIEVYRERIMALDWMSDATKEKALLKLDTMIINVCAPEEYNDWLEQTDFKSVADGGSYYQNMMEIAKAKVLQTLEYDGTQVDKTEWITSPQVVNAFYLNNFNSINFPIAILQAPFYDVNATREENLGGIGAVIAHEITHAFDSSGAQFDENGNALNWWTEEDAAAFEKLCQEVVEYFEGQEAVPGIGMDGELTLTENIADLGALACITAIGEKQEGFDFRKMYESYADIWRSTATREYWQYLKNVDTHSADSVRVDRVLQSVDQFYEVYDIQPGDGMWVAPEERVSIW